MAYPTRDGVSGSPFPFAFLTWDLLESSIWIFGTKEAKVLFITLLVLCKNTEGIVRTPLHAIFRAAGLTKEEGMRALAELEAPDDTSRCKLHEGSRVVQIEDSRGWGLLMPGYKKRREIEETALFHRLKSVRADMARRERDDFIRDFRQKVLGAQVRKDEHLPGPEGEPAFVASSDPTPFDLQAVWNENCHPLPRWTGHTARRTEKAKDRLREQPDLRIWADVVKALVACPWTNGTTGTRSRPDWRAGPDFLLRPSTLTKYIAGDFSPVLGGPTREFIPDVPENEDEDQPAPLPFVPRNSV